MAIPIRTPEEIDAVAAAGRALWRVLGELAAAAVPGARTVDLDALARRLLAREGAEPLLGGVRGPGGAFPGVVSVTVNEEATHAPPGPRVLRAGDLVSIDLAASLGGWCADAARALVVGGAPGPAAGLAAAAAAIVDSGIRAVGPGIRWSAVAGAMASAAAAAGVRLVGGLAGHGIGRALHEPPAAPAGPAAGDEDFVLRPGMILTLEPTVTRGSGELAWLADGWTGVTGDRAWACHEERTVAVVRSGRRVLTG